MGRRRGSRGRSSSRRSRGKSGGQGSGGSGKGKGKGKGGSRGRSSGTRGGQGKGGSGKGKGTGGSRGRSSNTRGGQSKANRNQNKKARRTVKSIANSRVGKAIGKGLSTVGKVTRQLRQPMSGLASLGIRSVLNNPSFATSVASAIANSKYASDYNNPNARDKSKMTPQQIKRLERLSQKTGVDYFSPRKVVGKINLSADSLAGLGKFRNAGWYTGLTNRFPGIKNIRVNKTFYGRDRVKGWHSSQRPGRGHGLLERPEIRRHPGRGQDQFGPEFPGPIRGVPGGRTPQRINTGSGRGGPVPMPRSILSSQGNYNLQSKGAKRRMAKSLAAFMAARRGI